MKGERESDMATGQEEGGLEPVLGWKRRSGRAAGGRREERGNGRKVRSDNTDQESLLVFYCRSSSSQKPLHLFYHLLVSCCSFPLQFAFHQVFFCSPFLRFQIHFFFLTRSFMASSFPAFLSFPTPFSCLLFSL